MGFVYAYRVGFCGNGAASLPGCDNLLTYGKCDKFADLQEKEKHAVQIYSYGWDDGYSHDRVGYLK